MRLHAGRLEFPPTANPSSDPNTLDDYEEGTWGPVMTQPGATFTHSYQYGLYTKVGNLVTITGTLGWSAKSGGSGNVGFSNLPFTTSGSTAIYVTGVCGDYTGFTFPSASYTQMNIELSNNASTGLFWANGSNVAGTPVVTIGSSGIVFFSASYFV